MDLNLVNRKLHIFTCMNDPDQPCVALFEGVNVIIRGKTPMQAKMNAEKWRLDVIRTDKRLTAARRAELLAELGA